jgi:hypothetical protein
MGVKSGRRVRWAKALPSALPYLRDYRPADDEETRLLDVIVEDNDKNP